jgi:hypothetical protein
MTPPTPTPEQPIFDALAAEYLIGSIDWDAAARVAEDERRAP